MARGDVLTPRVIQMIRDIHLDNPDLNGKHVADKLRRRLGSKASRNFTWPADVTVRQWIRQIDDKRNPEDHPWGLSSLPQYFPPEALPAILRVWAYSRGTLQHVYTARDAKWTSRLFALFPQDKDVPKLTAYVLSLSQAEILSELTKNKATWDTTENILSLYLDSTGKHITGKQEARINNVKKDHFTRQDLATMLNGLEVFPYDPEGAKWADQRFD